jgi:formate dehydrogenase subunit gamma
MTTRAISPARAAGQNEELVPRYTLGERTNHWISALAFIYLLITGLAFWSPYLYWLATIVGGGPIARAWHPWVGLIFAVSLFWMFAAWRRDMRIDDSDRAWAKAMPDYIQSATTDCPRSAGSTTGRSFFSGQCFTA